ncbi:MAG: hypothetical protein LC135_01900 [Phycisphaerae bacterium]|nr:hypothetical protein [Phycisphaerae bacterium]MCZ2398607.1 hypothetical protein [Phycisphaerae bacterium]
MRVWILAALAALAALAMAGCTLLEGSSPGPRTRIGLIGYERVRSDINARFKALVDAEALAAKLGLVPVEIELVTDSSRNAELDLARLDAQGAWWGKVVAEGFALARELIAVWLQSQTPPEAQAAGGGEALGRVDRLEQAVARIEAALSRLAPAGKGE